MWLYIEVFVGAFFGGLIVGLIAWGVSKVKCTTLKELPDRPISMEHEHGGEGNG